MIVACLLLIALIIVPVFLFDSEKSVLDDSVRSSLAGKFIKLPDGFTHYERSGPEGAPAVVLIHGFSVPYYIWDPTFKALKESDFDVLRYDLYGRGYSDRPDTQYGIELFIDQLENLLTALQIDQPVNLVGLSFGGPVAAGFRQRFPGKIRSLCFIDPLVLPVQEDKIFPMNVPVIGEYLVSVVLAPFILPQSQKDDFYRPEQFPGWEEKYRDQMRYKGFKRAILSTMRYMPAIDAVPWYTAIGKDQISVLLLWGEGDKSLQRTDMEELAKVIPQTRFHAIGEAAHLPHYEQPEVVNPILINFLKDQ